MLVKEIVAKYPQLVSDKMTMWVMETRSGEVVVADFNNHQHLEMEMWDWVIEIGAGDPMVVPFYIGKSHVGGMGNAPRSLNNRGVGINPLDIILSGLSDDWPLRLVEAYRDPHFDSEAYLQTYVDEMDYREAIRTVAVLKEGSRYAQGMFDVLTGSCDKDTFTKIPPDKWPYLIFVNVFTNPIFCFYKQRCDETKMGVMCPPEESGPFSGERYLSVYRLWDAACTVMQDANEVATMLLGKYCDPVFGPLSDKSLFFSHTHYWGFFEETEWGLVVEELSKRSAEYTPWTNLCR